MHFFVKTMLMLMKLNRKSTDEVNNIINNMREQWTVGEVIPIIAV